MLRILVCTLLVSMPVGCVHSGTESEWIVLDSASSVDCAAWPQKLADLRIDEFSVLPGTQPGIFVTGVNREGNPIHYYTDFENDIDIDEDKVAQLQLGRNAILFGGNRLGSKRVAVIAKNKKEKARVELRDVNSNVVELQSDLADAEVIEGQVRRAGGSDWIMYKLDGSGVRLAHLATSDKAALKVIRGIEFDNYPILLSGENNGQSVVMWSQGTTGKVFRLKSINHADGKVSNASQLDVPISSQVESWSAGSHGDGYVLAYVDGDSLVGQSKLRLAGFKFLYGVAESQWTQDVPLNDVHVTEPTIVSRGDSLDILLLNWVDEESTIVRYRVVNGVISKPEFHGIFPKGTRIIDAFESGGDSYVVTRQREGAGWKFQICEL